MRRRSRRAPARGWSARARRSAPRSTAPRQPSLAAGQAAAGAVAEESARLAHRAAPDVDDVCDAGLAQPRGSHGLEVDAAPGAARPGGEPRRDLVADLVAADARARA